MIDEPITRVADTNDLIYYGPGSTIVLNKMTSSSPSDIIEYHRIATCNRVLSQGEIYTISDNIEQPIPVEDPIEPNLLHSKL
jgi:hypothetical protein